MELPSSGPSLARDVFSAGLRAASSVEAIGRATTLLHTHVMRVWRADVGVHVVAVDATELASIVVA